jgi:RES domain-containing protein
VILWRIATETRSYAADDLSGTGAARRPGRWNDDTQPVIYAASTLALAVLETVAHVQDDALPLNRYVVRIDVPATVWRRRQQLQPAELPTTWDAIPAGRASVAVGSQWLRSRRSPLLMVPSVVVPEEPVVLVNPQHPAALGIVARAVRRFEYNRLFRLEGPAS